MRRKSRTKKLLVVDDHGVVREGLRRILEAAPDIRVAGEASNGEECLAKLAEGEYDAVILDIQLPGTCGLETLRRIRASHPEVPVVVFSIHAEDQYALRALKLGAAGYVVKEESPATVLEAIRKVLDGQAFITPKMAEKLARHLSSGVTKDPLDTLSAREDQVLRQIVSGKRIKDIATELGLNVKTVSTYRGRILRKLGLPNLAALMRYAMENQLI
ncbi:MAG: response regulator transcription factor [Kiritimatiellae bacterium]|nr:response regulator transcription factor [Kiritimatiellia bacterium]